MRPAQGSKARRVLKGHRPDDEPGHARVEPALRGFLVADAAPELYRNGQGLADTAHQLGIRGNTLKGTIQIDEMQVFRPLLLPLPRGGHGIVKKNRGVLSPAAFEAHGLTSLDVNGGEKNHRPNSLIILSIASWLSSCVVTHLAPRLKNVSKFIRLSLSPTCFSLKWERATSAPSGSRTSMR